MEVLVIVSAKDKLGRFDVVNTALCDLSSTIDYYGVKELYVKPEEQLNIALSVDKNEIKADGEESATFSVSLNNQPITNGVTIYSLNDSKALNGMSFSTTEAGEYRFVAAYEGYFSNEVRIVAKAVEGSDGEGGSSGEETDSDKEYNVGDYYNVNGVEGIVFAIETDVYETTWCYVFSLDEADLQWSKINVDCGYNHGGTGQWMTEDLFNPKYGGQNIDDYPAFKWCIEHGEGWFMPSTKELQWIWTLISGGTHKFDSDSVKAYNKLLVEKGGMPFNETYYMSSNENSTDMMEIVAFMEDSIVCLEPYKTSTNFTVRAAYRFQVE
jgi:hypothetical protein